MVHSVKDWNEFGVTIGIWVSVLVGLVTLVKTMGDMVIGMKIKK